ncbi:MAG: hypothetical protein WCI12_11635 [Actinomycetes bacterium]
MAVDGMDVHGAQVALGRISGQAGALSNAVRSLSGAIHALEWTGPDRDHFVAEFDSRSPNLLRAAQAQVANTANQLENEIRRQQAASDH